MIARIRKIAEHYRLSPAAFADLVGISRPVMSHIFSERNKPSLEVVQKIGMAFPEITLGWLLYGQGEMLNSITPIERPILEQVHYVVPEEDLLENNKENNQAEKSSNAVGWESGRKPSVPKDKGVVKIVLFYDDDTFQAFKPNA